MLLSVNCSYRNFSQLTWAFKPDDNSITPDAYELSCSGCTDIDSNYNCTFAVADRIINTMTKILICERVGAMGYRLTAVVTVRYGAEERLH